MTSRATGNTAHDAGYRCCWYAAVLLVAVPVSPALPMPHDDEDTLARVIAEQAAIHTGPGFAYRTVYVATRGEVLPVLERATRDHWFRVRLPDGTSGWVLGDQVFPLDLDTADAHRGPSLWHRLGQAVFSPSPLLEGNFGLSFSAGVLGGDSAFIFRPAVLSRAAPFPGGISGRDRGQPGGRDLFRRRTERLSLSHLSGHALPFGGGRGGARAQEGRPVRHPQTPPTLW